MPEEPRIDPDQVQYALLALYTHERDVRHFQAEPKRNELVLADAGMPLAAIATITGRNYETVKTTVRRARAAAAKGKGGA